VNWESWQALAVGRRLDRGDRVEWRGAQFAVVQFDDGSKSAAGDVFAIELQLRG
jgi:hypothetical protein